MKLSILIPSLEKGGIERSISRISRGLLDKGWDIELLVEKFSNEGTTFFDKKIYIKKFNAGSFNQNSNIIFLIFKNMILFFSVLKYLNKSNTDIVLVAKNAPLGVLIKKFSSNTFKLVIREAVNPSSASKIQRSFLSRKILNSIKRISYPYADKVIAISYGVKNSLISLLDLSPDSIEVIYNPAADSRIKELANSEVPPEYRKERHPTVISIGRLVPQKDHMTLIKAFERVLESVDARLLIIGEGQERKKLEKYIQQNKLSDNIKLLGYMSNPWKFLINSDLFVLSSLWEGFGNVIVEAMYLGIPVVSSDCESGPSEILNGGELGHLFKVGDDVQLSEIITSSLSEKERYLDIVNSAKRKSEEYSIETITEQYEAVFRGIIL